MYSARSDCGLTKLHTHLLHGLLQSGPDYDRARGVRSAAEDFEGFLILSLKPVSTHLDIFRNAQSAHQRMQVHALDPDLDAIIARTWQAPFHGHAHGTELPDAANPFAYGIGFVIATGLLHLAGIGLGFFVGSTAGRTVVRAAGAVIAAVGGAFLFGFA